MTKNDDKRVPALRFKGFNDDWAQRMLGKIAVIIMGQSPDGSTYSKVPSTYILVQGNADIKNGWVKPRLWSSQSTKEAQKGDIILTVRAPVGEVAKTNYDVVLGRGVAGIRGNDFIFHLLTLMNINNYWNKFSTGSTFESINSNDIKKAIVNIPPQLEQGKIGKLLNTLNNLIALQQRKMEQLKLLKKAMLQKGFTNKSAPTLRFKGFSKAWTEYPLGNLGKACSGYGFPNSEQGGNKGIPFYKVSDMNLAGNEDEMIYANNYVTDAQIDRNNWKPIVDVPAIFFAKVGAAVLLNRKRLCKRPFLLDNNTMAYSLNKNILSTQFTKSLFETINLPSFIQVGALPSYNTNDIESIKVKIPKIDEQEKIGILLKKIERLITRQQSKIKKLQSTKQFLLQNMFI